MRRTPAPVAACAVALVGAAAASALSPSETPPPPSPDPCATGLRCPDLVMAAPYHLTIDRHTRPGRVLLRASSSIDNHGSGPLELRGHRTGSRTMTVTQVVYRRGGARSFHAGAGLLGYTFVPGARFGYQVAGASYWKFRDAARFQLWSIDGTGRALRLVRFGPKLFYCFRDLSRTKPLGRSPSSAVYPACSENQRQRRVTLGTSVGWSDIYPYTYPRQWIDVTGLHGRFAYVQVADPFNRVLESNERDNVSETLVALPSGRVLGTRRGVATP